MAKTAVGDLRANKTVPLVLIYDSSHAESYWIEVWLFCFVEDVGHNSILDNKREEVYQKHELSEYAYVAPKLFDLVTEALRVIHLFLVFQISKLIN